jgi:hypothetical protein
MKFSRLFRLFVALLLLSALCLVLLQYLDYRLIRILLYVFFLSGVVTFMSMYLLKVLGKLDK